MLPPSQYEEYLHDSVKKFKDGNSAHKIFNGVESKTGYGGGNYPVFIRKNNEGLVVEIRIRFDLTYGFSEPNGPCHYIKIDKL